jgi:hypothetical protein
VFAFALVLGAATLVLLGTYVREEYLA